MKSFTITILAATSLAACGGTDESQDEVVDGPPCLAPAGHAEEALRSSGVERTFLQYVPSGARREAPLVIDLHGYSEGARLHAERTELTATARRHGFVLLTPDALPDEHGYDSWRIEPDSDDVAFVEELVDHAIAELCVDPRRVHVTGHSQGGFLISTLACTSADRITSVAPVAGMRAEPPGCAPSDAVPLYAIHGDADTTVPIDGGLSAAAAALLGMPEDGPSIASIVEDWRSRHPGVEAALHVVPDHPHAWWPPANELIWSFFERTAKA